MRDRLIAIGINTHFIVGIIAYLAGESLVEQVIGTSILLRQGCRLLRKSGSGNYRRHNSLEDDAGK